MGDGRWEMDELGKQAEQALVGLRMCIGGCGCGMEWDGRDGRGDW